LGREEFIKELAQDKRIHYTDTTFRDAHQSLLATRMRTTDMLKIAPAMAHHHAALFSMEVWGGATFDTAMRFLKESPWQRLQKLREAIPNIIFQMLFRGSNAVGYKAYPDNLIIAFIEKAAENGIDLFRIFDSLNWIENMKVSIKAVRERTNSLAEAAICYTGDILDPERSKKYNLQYYIDLAKQLEDEGAHLLCIKDMAGLLKPYSAGVLVNELKNAIKIPIHLHTHDTSSLQAATYLQAIEAGVDVIDVAIGAMSGLTSQPNFNSVVAMLKGHPRENAMNLQQLNKVSDYWAAVRTHYYPFESGLKAGTAEVFEHEMPGGQYSNLQQQAKAIGVTDFELIKKNYIAANQLLGDIVKVTPSSKVVGDLAIFMAANHLTEKDVLEKGATLSFPESVKGMLRGEIGQPHGGFPEAFQRLVLKDEPPFTKRPNDYLEPINLDSEFETFKIKFGKDYEFLDFLSYLLYPAVFEDYHKHKQQYGDVSQVPTKAFWFGMNEGEEILVEIDTGKTLIVKFLSRSNQPDENGDVIVAFEMNGQSRRVRVKDNKSGIVKQSNRKVSNENEIGAPLQGKLSSVKVKVGDNVKENTPLFVIEAMKMESVVTAPKAGKVKSIILHAGALVSQDDVVVELE
jgi:pyruvate carboxylase